MTLNPKKELSLLIERTKQSLEEGLHARGEKRGIVTDITTGTCFGNLSDDEDMSRDDLTLTINTDGGSVFKSSKASVWPLQCVLNELPPAVRFKNTVLAGLWFGSTHPDMQKFLGKFVSEFNSM